MNEVKVHLPLFQHTHKTTRRYSVSSSFPAQNSRFESNFSNFSTVRCMAFNACTITANSCPYKICWLWLPCMRIHDGVHRILPHFIIHLVWHATQEAPLFTPIECTHNDLYIKWNMSASYEIDILYVVRKCMDVLRMFCVCVCDVNMRRWYRKSRFPISMWVCVCELCASQYTIHKCSGIWSTSLPASPTQHHFHVYRVYTWRSELTFKIIDQSLLLISFAR